MSSNLLGHRKMYALVSDLVGADLRSVFKQSEYDKTGNFEWISVYSADRKFVLVSWFRGSKMAFSEWDLDGNRLDVRVLKG